MTATTSLAEMKLAAGTPREANMPTVRAGFFDLQGFELMQRVAKAFVSTDLVPKAYRGNLASCMIALNMAQRMNADPIFIMQNLYDVHGQPSWSSKFLIATVNACGRYASLKYEWRNEDKPGSEDYGCRAWTTEKATGERLNGVWVTWKMVRAEGWDSKNGSKWKTMPDQMFMYRAAAFWARTNAPELSMGLPTVEESQDIVDVYPDGTFTVAKTTVDELRGGTRATPAQSVDIVEASSQSDVGTTTMDDGGSQGDGQQPGLDIDESDDADRDGDAPTFQDVNRELLSAKSVEALDFARSLIAEIPDEAQKATLNQVAARRMRELTQAADESSTATPAGRRTRAPLNAD
ncbi:hypothetical protein OYT13_16875 [Pandoraea sp. XJJ-1]|uniref:hypothetical protein n=1 Tax=Pandoraea sp. XJJ-1 TaxID=3002643 RepID=UPI00227E2E28|nr:hypothetical protein [Pandoraea sp. XJJ-1]WAL81512.1 hypothetical protein OYT13_16875 [Pandoraea sp. XJJ-1]